MSIALILAGGCGVRTGQDVPKQFLTVYDTPIIVYTMLNLQNSGVFDEMYVVCSDGWSDFVHSYAQQYNVHIFKETISGGTTRFESMKNGVNYLKNHFKEDSDVVCLVDANRPLIPHAILNNVVCESKNCDGVVALAPCFDSMFVADKVSGLITAHTDRSVLYMGQTPEASTLKVAYECLNFPDDSLQELPLAGIMLQLKKTVHFVEGSSKSMKITTADDFSIFKSLLGDFRLTVIK